MDGMLISLNLVIDAVQNRVVFAEGDRDFVDMLLSFLVMPVGTAVRVAGGKSGLGCMGDLYKSVEGLDAKCFNTEECRRMLLFPANADRANCLRLVVSVYDLPSHNHYMCPNRVDGSGKHSFWSTDKGANCPTCRREMTWVSFPLYSDGSPSNVGVFLKGSDKYLITDDLRVSTVRTIRMEELAKLGVSDYSRLYEKTVKLGRKEAVNLFKHALQSKTPLSDTFLFGRRRAKAKIDKEALEISSNLEKPSNVEGRKMTMDLVVNKSNGKFLYAQAKEDAVNFFFSFLTIPLGLLSHVYNGSSSVGCIDHLRSSAKLLTEKGQIRTDEHSNMLLKPKLAPHYSCKDQILKFEEGSSLLTVRSKVTLDAINLKSASSTTEKGGNFVNGPTTFMITDNLDMKPASVSKDISTISKYNNVEVITVTMGEMEALKLLKASLTSSTPLTTVFSEKLPVVSKTSSPSAFSWNLFNTSWFKKAKN